jgi:hypothetical protein
LIPERSQSRIDTRENVATGNKNSRGDSRRSVRGIIAVLSVAACAAVIIAWILSYTLRSPEPLSVRVSDARYSIRSDRGWLKLLGPPSQPDGSPPDALNAVRSLTSDIKWRVVAVEADGNGTFVDYPYVFSGANNAPSNKIHTLSTAEVTRPLLAALENRNQFVAAHLWLTQKHLTMISHGAKRHADQLIIDYNGLQAAVRPSFLSLDRNILQEKINSRQRNHQDGVEEFCQEPNALSIDLGQLPKIRRQWHDKLDVTIIRLPYALLMACVASPTLWVPLSTISTSTYSCRDGSWVVPQLPLRPAGKQRTLS